MADDFTFNILDRKEFIATYPTPKTKVIKSFKTQIRDDGTEVEEKREPLTTKNAVKFLLEGRLKNNVCRYCLNVTKPLSELDQIMQVASKGMLFKVTIRDMVATCHPFKVPEDSNFPNKICNKCLSSAIKAYLFSQQCEQAERALRNCFDDMYEKVEHLDPIEAPKKRGRRKLNPNYNILYTEHERVIDYAQPIITLINTSAEALTPEDPITDLECLKCCQVLPNVESLLNHEKLHPKSMWYNCRMCGKTFAKRYQMKRHIQSHLHNKPIKNMDTSFVCKKCCYENNDYKEFLQHIEKHKFKMVMEHLFERKMDKLCSVCLDKGSGMVDLETMVRLHGGCPNLTGDRSIHAILASSLPDMNDVNNYTGTKICEKCYNLAVNTYIFTNQFLFNRTRLNTCITLMLKNLNEITNAESNIFVEISENAIMPLRDEIDDVYLCDINEYIDETKLKADVLEDEFRIDSTSDSGSEIEDNPARLATKTYAKSHLVNGVKSYNSLNVCSEFLKFKSKTKKVMIKYTCPLCYKHFITDYHLKRHILKHVVKKVECKICSEVFESKFHLQEHNKVVHKSKKDYVCCTQCYRSFLMKEKLEKHIKKHTNKLCELCEKLFKTQKDYNVHMQRHKYALNKYRTRHVLNCSFCEKEFYSKNELLSHVNREHIQMKTYNCDMCERQFYTVKNLRSHQKVHSLYSKETCMFCGKVLKCRKHLVYHVQKHLGEKPFKCEFCWQSFQTKKKAKLHMKLYHGGNFSCTYCKKVFITKLELKEHVDSAHSFI